jgi:hypothetical protein
MNKALLLVALALLLALPFRATGQVDQDKPTVRFNTFNYEGPVTIFFDGAFFCTVNQNMCVANTNPGWHTATVKIEGRADQTTKVQVHKQHNSNPAFQGTKDEWEVVGVCMVWKNGNLDCSDEE